MDFKQPTSCLDNNMYSCSKSAVSILVMILTSMANENIHLYEAALIYGYKDPNYVSSLHKKLFGYNITEKAPKNFFK